MSKNKLTQNTLSRRTVLRRGAVLSTCLALGLTTTTGQAAAMNKAELIERMASEAGLTKDEIDMALDAFTDVTTKALKKGDRIKKGDSVALTGFGVFSRAPGFDGKGNDVVRSPVDFDACPEFDAALGLSPGNGDGRRAEASSRCHKADVVIDTERIADETQRGRHSGLSKADSKKALDAFISVTTKALKGGDVVSLAGFGSFSISKRSARTGRNRDTGKEIKIAAKNVVKFKAGAELSKAVN
jgi:nucleoid DNA-binding protein